MHLDKTINTREDYLREIKRLLRYDNRFTLMEIRGSEKARGYEIYFDTEFYGFERKLERRVISYRTIDDIETLIKLGYDIFVIDLVTLAIWVKKTGKAVVHWCVVKEAFMDLLNPRAVRKSLDRGFVSVKSKPKGLFKRQPSRGLRKKIREKYVNKCIVCDNETDVSIHHVLPLRQSGVTEESNLVLLCKRCHRVIEEEGPIGNLPEEIIDEIENKPFGIYLWTMWQEDFLDRLNEIPVFPPDDELIND